MKEAIQLTGITLKCDEPDCNYEQPADLTNLEAYRDALCPDCGAPLMSDEDMNVMRDVCSVVNMLNSIAKETPELLGITQEDLDNAERASMSIKYDSTTGELEAGEIKYVKH